MELAILKTIAAFLNMNGGTLIIGVSDDGEPVGIEADKFPDEDNMNLHLINIIKERIGTSPMLYISARFDDYQDVRVMVVGCSPAKSPVFVKDGPIEKFYIRKRAATFQLPSQPDPRIYQQTLCSIKTNAGQKRCTSEVLDAAAAG